MFDDLIKIVKWVIDNEPIEKVYNACSGDVYDYYTLAQKVIDISSSKPTPIAFLSDLGTTTRPSLSIFRFIPLPIISMYNLILR